MTTVCNASGDGRAGARASDVGRARGLLGPSRSVVAVLAALMVYPVVLVAIASQQGPGISPDSVMYVSAARSLAASGQLIAYTGEPLSIFPPGLSVVLGLLASAGLPVQLAAVLLNGLCVALIVGLTYLLATELFGSRLLGLMCGAVVSVSISTARVYSMIYSEPLFVVSTTSVLLILTRMVRLGRVSWGPVLAVAALVSAASSLRFIGFTLIPMVALGVWLAGRSVGIVQRIAQGAGAAVLSSIGLVGVAARNVSLHSSALGDRYPSGLTVMAVAEQSLRGLGEHVVPESLGGPTVLAGGVVMVALIVLGALGAVVTRRWGLVLIAVFTAGYWATLAYSQISTQIDPVNERLLAPVFTPMVVLAVHAVTLIGGRLRLRTTGSIGRAFRFVAAAVLFGGLLVSVAAGMHYAVAIGSVGRGFNRAEELASPLATAVKALPPDAGIASTNPAQTYWTTGRQPVEQIPLRSHYSAAEQTAEVMRRLVQATASGAVDYLIYVEPTADALTPKELHAQGVRAHLVAEFDDGSVWQVSRP